MTQPYHTPAHPAPALRASWRSIAGPIRTKLSQRPLQHRIRAMLPDWVVLVGDWRKAHGRLPRLFRPVTLNEKILHRIMFHHRPLFTRLADKAAVRGYVEQRLGPDVLPTLYHLTDRPDTIPFARLPDRFVVKSTHASGQVQVVHDKSTLDRAALVQTCMSWLGWSLYKETREWQYRDIPPRIIVEEFIDDGSGYAPNDYKLYVFDGVVALIHVSTERFGDHRLSFFTRDWVHVPMRLKYHTPLQDVPRPARLAELIAAAETLGRGLDFVRADFYATDERIYFGELTLTPTGGVEPFEPAAWDRRLGDLWKLRRR
jgi:hypothetical protein